MEITDLPMYAVGIGLAAIFVVAARSSRPLIPNFIDNTVEQPRNIPMRASIISLNDGRFGLATSEGIVGSYSRARDARRGAKRLGFVVA